MHSTRQNMARSESSCSNLTTFWLLRSQSERAARSNKADLPARLRRRRWDTGRKDRPTASASWCLHRFQTLRIGPVSSPQHRRTPARKRQSVQANEKAAWIFQVSFLVQLRLDWTSYNTDSLTGTIKQLIEMSQLFVKVSGRGRDCPS